MRCDIRNGLLSQLVAGVAIFVVTVGVAAISFGNYTAGGCDDGNGTGATTCKSATNHKAQCGENGAGAANSPCDSSDSTCVCTDLAAGCNCWH